MQCSISAIAQAAFKSRTAQLGDPSNPAPANKIADLALVLHTSCNPLTLLLF
jgi:hypothetical protein